MDNYKLLLYMKMIKWYCKVPKTKTPRGLKIGTTVKSLI